MANLSLYHQNILSSASVTASELEPLSSPRFLSDDRLSFKMSATGIHTLVQIDQPGGAVQPFAFLIFVDHSMSGGTAVVTTYPTDARLSPAVVFSGSLSSDDPHVIDLGGVPADLQFVDVELTTSGGQKVSVGELMLASRFESPERPALGIGTRYIPRRTFIETPNGERLSVRHGGTVRQKTYTIPGLRFEEGRRWIDLFRGGEGTELCVLIDDEGETYPALMNQELGVSTTARIVDIGLEFTEVKLS